MRQFFVDANEFLEETMAIWSLGLCGTLVGALIVTVWQKYTETTNCIGG